MKKSEYTIVLAGGGTGGHLFPGIALAGELADRSGDVRIVFAVSSKSLDREIIEENGYEMRTIGTPNWRRGILRYPFMMLGIATSCLRSAVFMIKHRCRAVIGLGGYASFGPILAGFLLRRGVYLLEQNTIPGKANRFLARFSRNVFTQFESSGSYFKNGKALSKGNPVRKDIIALRNITDENGFAFLVMGGSQGAKRLNEIFIASCSQIRFPGGSKIYHLCGKANLDACKKGYEQIECGAEVETIGFQKDMASLIGKAGLCLCRSGATSIAELTCAGVPLVMVPYPYATDDHQYLNALEIEKAGAGVCIREEDLDPEKLAELINGILEGENRLKEMREASLKVGRPEAGPHIADIIMKRIAG